MRQQMQVVRVKNLGCSVGIKGSYGLLLFKSRRFYGIMASGQSGEHNSSEKQVSRTLPADQEFVNEIEVKKSKFVATAWHVTSGEEAMVLIERSKDLGASHNCFAYKIGQNVRASDDGEPSGTAGRPILGVLEGMNVDNVAVMVTRYFGGTKLGTGGLVRAYSGAARELLKQTPMIESKPVTEVTVQVPVDAIGIAFSVLDSLGAVKTNEIFDESCGNMFNISFTVEADKKKDALQKMKDGSRGRIVHLSS